jgi:hypothetical protein
MSQFHSEACDPPVAPIRLADQETPVITARMQALFAADQAARQSTAIDWARISQEDSQRRHETLHYLTTGQISAPESLYFAAFIFQHGNCPEHYELAHELAELALDCGYTRARWISAASLDRSLMSRGLPQKYGTQYIAYGDGPLNLYDYDPATTDEERAAYNVPPLRELLRRVQPTTDECEEPTNDSFWR